MRDVAVWAYSVRDHLSPEICVIYHRPSYDSCGRIWSYWPYLYGMSKCVLCTRHGIIFSWVGRVVTWCDTYVRVIGSCRPTDAFRKNRDSQLHRHRRKLRGLPKSHKH